MAEDRIVDFFSYKIRWLPVDAVEAGDNLLLAAEADEQIHVLGGYLSPEAGSTVRVGLKMGERTVMPMTPVEIGTMDHPCIQWTIRTNGIRSAYPHATGDKGESFFLVLSDAVHVMGNFEIIVTRH